MRGRTLLVISLLSIIVAVGCTAEKSDSSEVYMVPMRDGVKLATGVVVPEGDGPWPVILMRTPYNKEGPLGGAERFSKQGFAVVVQDLRGRFASEGTDTVFMTDGWGELQDGYDTIEWIADQGWCDGNVGMLGGSALGITQYLAAGADSEHLKCCHATVAAASMYHQAGYQGGAFRKALVERWMKGNNFSDKAWELIVSNPLYNDLWATMNLTERAPQVDVPMMHIGGWYDIFVQGTIDAFVALQYEGGQGARGNQIMVIGPWVHGCRPGGDLEYPESAHKNPSGKLTGPWFDKWLRGAEAPALDGPPVYYYVMGACGEDDAAGNEWRRADDWPIPANNIAVYLHKSGALSLNKPQDDAASLSFEYDPADPVPTIGGHNLMIPSGPKDQRPAEKRDDVLVFESPVLEQPVEVTGRIRAKLYVSSDCPDTDFTAKITDVYPDGRSMLVTDGILRMRFRNGFREAELMEPGEVYEANIDLWSTSIAFNKGHRVRVAISSSNAPRFDPNPNTGAGFRGNDETRVATNTIYCDRDRPSHIILPIPGQ